MKKESNKKTVAKLFEKRTGVQYQNHIQAMSVQKQLDRRLDVSNPIRTEIVYKWTEDELAEMGHS